MTVTPKQPRAPNKFKVDSGGYLVTEADRKLKEALQDWRSAQLQNMGVMNGNDMFGVQFIMTDDVLDRIVDLAHFDQIDSLTAIQGQVNWRYCDRWGPDILDIVNSYARPAAMSPPRETLGAAENLPGPSTGHRATATNTGASSSKSKPRTRGQYRCGACGGIGHIGMLFILRVWF